MNYSEAVKQAKKYRRPGANQYVRMGVEVALAYLDINQLEVVGWRGDYLVVRQKPSVSNQLEEKEETNDETYPF